MLDVNFTMSDGEKIPAIGFGTFQINNDDVTAAVVSALKLGYRHIDTAEMYYNEEGIGKGLKESGLSRDKFFITTKVWPGGFPTGDPKTKKQVIDAVDASLSNLGLSFIDLIILHGPFGDASSRIEQYSALVECQKAGKVKSIGVSNYGIAHLKGLLEAGLPKPAINQIEIHPLCTKTELVDYMKSQNILVVAYSSLAPHSAWREGYTAYSGSRSPEEKLESTFAADIAKEMNVSEARVLLKWALQHGYCILPKSNKESRILENSDMDFIIRDDHMKKLDSMDKNLALAFGTVGNAYDPITHP